MSTLPHLVYYVHPESDCAGIEFKGVAVAGDPLCFEVGDVRMGTQEEFEELCQDQDIPPPYYRLSLPTEQDTTIWQAWMQLRQQYASGQVIDQFTGRYRFLSNFHPSTVTCDMQLQYATVEHAFQAWKSLERKDRQMIMLLPTPTLAKRAGRQVKLRPDWEQIKEQTMRHLVWQKFSRHNHLRQQLLATGRAQLIEGNDWGDVTWGCVWQNGKWAGHNKLGLILMEVRKELSNAG